MSAHPLRRVTWREDGRPVHIIAEPGGALDRIASDVERQQIANARNVIELAGYSLDCIETTEEAIFVIERLRECAVELLDICDVRGERLAERS